MTHHSGLAAAMTILLLASGCNDQQGSMNAAGGNTAIAPANAAGAATNAVVDAANTTAPAPGDILTPYIGKHPSEKVGDLTFLDQPSVKAAVAAVPDAKVRDFVFHYTGPDAPIVEKQGRILAWGCEEHNCGYHNWSVSIARDGTNGEVCFYHDDNKADGPATWYLAGGKTEQRPGNCPSE